jgi:hypothetical protein
VNLKQVIMKKIILILFVNLVLCFSVKAQLNPVNNMIFGHTYETPYNCFYLSWDEPVVSFTDTLTGYNIYHDDSLFMFTTERFHSCSPCIGQPYNAFCDFIDYNMGNFYIHVTAVYNIMHQESAYNDSIDFGGIVINVSEIPGNDPLTITGFSQRNSSLMIELNQVVEAGELHLENLMGQTTGTTRLKNQKYIEISTSGTKPGIYLIHLQTVKQNLTKVIFIK